MSLADLRWQPDTATLGEIRLWDANPKQMPRARAERLLASWKDKGQFQTLAVGPDGECYDGHQRVQALRAAGYPDDYELYVMRSSRALTDQERREIVIDSTWTTVGKVDWEELSGWPDEALEPLRAQGEALLADWNDDAANMALMLEADEEELPEDPGAEIDRAEELREAWGVETGQLWQLGEHRLVCGDCTDKAVVARVMDGEKARLVWTDPPYGVSYGDKLAASNPMGYRVRRIVNDDLPVAQLEAFIRSALIACARATVPGAAIYVACPPGTLLPTLIASFVGSGFDFHWGLVWVKDQLVLGRGDYHFKHENILYGWKPDAGHYFTDDRKQTSVFEVPRPKISAEHPTMKPPELVEAMVVNSSQVNESVIDPFLGSGTTLVACERLGRKCRAIEIEPKYVAVTLQRWHDMTGEEPVLLD